MNYNKYSTPYVDLNTIGYVPANKKELMVAIKKYLVGCGVDINYKNTNYKYARRKNIKK